MDVKADAGQKGDDKARDVMVAATPHAPIAMPPAPCAPKDRDAMPYIPSPPPRCTGPATSGAEVPRRGNDKELPRTRVSDIDPCDGVATSFYVRSIESLSSTLRTYGAAVLEPSPEDRVLLQCGLQAARLYFSQVSGEKPGLLPKNNEDIFALLKNSHSRQPERSLCCSRLLHESFTFRAEELDSESGHETKAPPCADRIFALLGKIARIALASIARSFGISSHSLLANVDNCPLMAGEKSTSCLTLSASLHPGVLESSGLPTFFSGERLQASSNAAAPVAGVKAEENLESGVQCDVSSLEKERSRALMAEGEQVVSGFLLLVAADFPGLEVKDNQGKWWPVEEGLPPGCLLVLAGKKLQETTNGHCQASTFRVIPAAWSNVSMPDGRVLKSAMPSNPQVLLRETHFCVHPVSRCAFGFHLNPRERRGPLSSSSTEKCAQAFKSGILSSVAAILRDPLSGKLISDAMIAPCGHSFGGKTLQNVIESMLCAQCKGSVSLADLVPNLIVRELVNFVKREEANHHGPALLARIPGGAVRTKKSLKKATLPNRLSGDQVSISVGRSTEKARPPERSSPSCSKVHGELVAVPEGINVAVAADSKDYENEVPWHSGDFKSGREMPHADTEGHPENAEPSGRGLEEEDEDNFFRSGDDNPQIQGSKMIETCAPAGAGDKVVISGGARGMHSTGSWKSAKRKKDKEGSGSGVNIAGFDDGRTTELQGGSGGALRLPMKKYLGTHKFKASKSIGADGPFSPDRERERAEGSRLKGVQFPFSVNDRVVIKGNKRTPEKFVGREAVVTSQCLNGWYLVRTLDTGDSVRLQYRSLQRSSRQGTDMMSLTLLPPTQTGEHQGGDPPTASPPFCTGQQLATRALSPLSTPMRSPLEGELPPQGADEQGSTVQPMGLDSLAGPEKSWLKPLEGSSWREAVADAACPTNSTEESSDAVLRMFMAPEGGDVSVAKEVNCDFTAPTSGTPGISPPFFGMGGGSLVELSLAVAAVSEGYVKDDDLGQQALSFKKWSHFRGPEGVLTADGGCALSGGRKRYKNTHSTRERKGLLTLAFDSDGSNLAETLPEATIAQQLPAQGLSFRCDGGKEVSKTLNSWVGESPLEEVCSGDDQQIQLLCVEPPGESQARERGSEQGTTYVCGGGDEKPDKLERLFHLGLQDSIEHGRGGTWEELPPQSRPHSVQASSFPQEHAVPSSGLRDSVERLSGGFKEPKQKRMFQKGSKRDSLTGGIPEGQELPGQHLSVRLRLPGKLTKVKQAQRVSSSEPRLARTLDGLEAAADGGSSGRRIFEEANDLAGAGRGGDHQSQESVIELTPPASTCQFGFAMMPPKKRDLLGKGASSTGYSRGQVGSPQEGGPEPQLGVSRPQDPQDSENVNAQIPGHMQCSYSNQERSVGTSQQSGPRTAGAELDGTSIIYGGLGGTGFEDTMQAQGSCEKDIIDRGHVSEVNEYGTGLA